MPPISRNLISHSTPGCTQQTEVHFLDGSPLSTVNDYSHPSSPVLRHSSWLLGFRHRRSRGNNSPSGRPCWIFKDNSIANSLHPLVDLPRLDNHTPFSLKHVALYSIPPPLFKCAFDHISFVYLKASYSDTRLIDSTSLSSFIIQPNSSVILYSVCLILPKIPNR